MTTWSIQNLKDITSKIGSGATPRGGKGSYHKEGIPLIRSLNIHDLNFIYDDLAFIDQKQAQQLDNVLVEKEDILLNITGVSGCRCTSVPDNLVPARVNQHVSIIRADKKNLYGKYLKYVLVSPMYKEALFGLAQTGATREALTKNDIENFEIRLPDLASQKNIFSLLSAYDDLIDNNKKRIKILEEMAQLLYTEWFVEFKFPGYEKMKMVESKTSYGMIPEGWEIKKLGKLINVKKGKNITKDTITNGNIPVVAGGIEPAYYHNVANTKAPVITISASGASAGFTKLYFQDIWASDCSYIDKSVTEFVYFFYLFLKNKQKEISNLQRGSAQPHVYPKDLIGLKIIYSSEIIKQLDKSLLPLFELVGKLKDTNINLIKIRDLLIPQLVTGKRELKN